MAKKTIEQLLSPVILADIQALLNIENQQKEELYTLKLTNNLRNYDKSDTRTTIQAVIQAGSGDRSDVTGVLANNITIGISFIVDANFTKKFKAVLNSYCIATHRYLNTVTDPMAEDPLASPITYDYYFKWKFADSSGDPFSISLKGELPVKEETVRVQMVYLSGTLYHSVGLAMDDTSILLEIPGTVTVRSWITSTLSYYSAVGSATPYQSTVSVMEGWGMGDLPDADGYQCLDGTGATINAPLGHALRVNDGLGYTYFKLDDVEEDGMIYTPLVGVADIGDSLQPSFNPTPLVEEYNPALDCVGDTHGVGIKLARSAGNVVHNYLRSLFYNDRTVTSFDINVQIVVDSISVSNKYAAKLSNLQLTKADRAEYLSFSLTLLDKIV